jgi:uncharacterized protein
MNLDIKERGDGITIECFVSPRSKKSAIKGLRGGSLAVGLNAPPVDGKANRALIDFISKLLKVPQSRISVFKGEHNKQKVLLIQGISKVSALEQIEPHLIEFKSC